MSIKALPVLFINLSGEMMYILDQRLRAQSICKEKSTKVMNDIVRTMFNDQFIKELFKPQEVYSKDALRTVFEKLAHSSIMRLNGTSMVKLYDLMTMVFKYQLCLCPRPEDVLLVTLNHLDGIRSLNEDSPDVIALVDNVYVLLMECFRNMSSGKFQRLRYTLLSFFQDLQIRVSVMLKEGCQRTSGKFTFPKGGHVPYGFNVPGTISAYTSSGSITKTTIFPTADQYLLALPAGSLEKEGNREINLGKNIYLEHENSEKTKHKGPNRNHSNSLSSEIANISACEELSFLAHLIGQHKVKDHPHEFTLGIFDEDHYDDSGCKIPPSEDGKIINIDVSQRMEETTLHKIMGDLMVEEQEIEDQDLLDLLDSVAS